MADFKRAQTLVGVNEGGYQNNPNDLGNYYKGKLIGTNWGISAPVLANYLQKEPTVQDMKNLTAQIAEKILKTNYWTKNNLGKIKNQSVANLLYDGVVNHGSNGMRMLTSKALLAMRKPLDYYLIFTPNGIKHLNKLNDKRLFFNLKKARADKYRKSKQTEFVKGWLKRLDRIQYYSSRSISALWSIVPIVLIGLLLIGVSL